jgi:hypothetical protein
MTLMHLFKERLNYMLNADKWNPNILPSKNFDHFIWVWRLIEFKYSTLSEKCKLYGACLNIIVSLKFYSQDYRLGTFFRVKDNE